MKCESHSNHDWERENSFWDGWFYCEEVVFVRNRTVQHSLWYSCLKIDGFRIDQGRFLVDLHYEMWVSFESRLSWSYIMNCESHSNHDCKIGNWIFDCRFHCPEVARSDYTTFLIVCYASCFRFYYQCCWGEATRWHVNSDGLVLNYKNIKAA